MSSYGCASSRSAVVEAAVSVAGAAPPHATRQTNQTATRRTGTGYHRAIVLNPEPFTYSVLVPKLAPDDLAGFVHAELDRCGLPHAVFTQEALALIVRSSEGILRRVRNLCVGAFIEAEGDRIKTVDLEQVNRVLVQPHWREHREHAA